MGAGAYLEPLAVISLLFGGAWINRARDETFTRRPVGWIVDSVEPKDEKALDSNDGVPKLSKPSLSPSLPPSKETRWRDRELQLLGYRKAISTPNTAVFRDRLLSRLLHKFPFLVEAWYWALIYWVGLSLRYS